MKILSAEQLRSADQFTIENEPIPSIELMERASTEFVLAFLDVYSKAPKEVSIFCGVGNNGGDGLAIARLLHLKGWEVQCIIIEYSDKYSEDNLINQERLNELNSSTIKVSDYNDLPDTYHSIIIDALVGIGISRPLEGLLLDIVQFINTLNKKIVSVDLPSGLFVEGDCSEYTDKMIYANQTFTFQTPKLNYLFQEYSEIVGEWKVLDIGLNRKYIDALECIKELTDEELISNIIKPRSEHSHKGTYGHGALVCGSKGMMGAAVLCTIASLRSGLGLTTIFAPECGMNIIQITCPEAMFMSSGEAFFEEKLDLYQYSSIGIGPGIGKSNNTKEALSYVLKRYNKPFVLDADALNLLKEDELNNLPNNSILTPDPKEFSRLFGETKNSNDRLQLAIERASQYKIIIILKGRYTSVISPDGNIYFNSTGNPGMAKGGSGDVLTGLLTGLLGRGYNPLEASILGCYIHGLAGDISAKKLGIEAMKAMDIADCLPDAFKEVYSSKEITC
ncbi:MAG: bifunctional ADP-dependent NAD(P)H-hydrate dehydratase/NAD(P)H-hydrate epimerase [Candidatus Kapaibacteriales bacterium]